MFAKPQSLFVILALAVSSLGDVRTTEAQGILQRLGDRIRTRVLPLPVTPFRPSLDPNRYNANPGNPDPATQPNQPRVVAPITPDGSANPAQIPGASNPDTSRSAQPTPMPADGRPTAAIDLPSTSDFGSSILAPQDNTNALTENPRAAAQNGNAPSDTFSRTTDNRATIGIRVLDPRPEMPLVELVGFNDGSMADEAGLQTGDVILSIDGVRTPNIAAIAEQLSQRDPGQIVRVQVGRQNQTMMFSVPLVSASNRAPVPNTLSQDDTSRAIAEAPSQNIAPQPTPTDLTKQPTEVAPENPQSPKVASGPELGIDVIEPEGSRGASVVAVEPGSPADIYGIKVGDRIVAVDHRFVVDTERLDENMMTRREPLAPMPVKLVRDDELVDLVIHFDGTPPTRDPKSSSQVADSGPSILSGLGSKLGGLLGAKSAQNNAKDAESLSQSPSNSDPVELPAPLPLDEPGRMPDSSKVVAAKAGDSLEFGDSEPINQVIFEDAAKANTSSPTPPAGDEQVRSQKPSLAIDTIDSSSKASSDASSDDVLDELRAEIERLQRRLESLEKAKKD